MKGYKIITLALIILFSISNAAIYSKDLDKNSNLLLMSGDDYLAVVDKMPEPVGGIKALYSKLKYPEAAKSSQVQGKVYILAFISETGTVDDVKVIMGIGSGCDDAAKEAVKGTKFVPAEIKGKPTKAKYSIAVDFKID